MCSHTGETPLKYTKCGQTLVNSATVSDHIKTHSLFSCHSTAYVIDKLLSKNMAAALIPPQARSGVKIKQLYSKKASYFRESMLTKMKLDKFQVKIKKTIDENADLRMIETEQ